MPEDNGKSNPEESYTACSCGYKLVCVDDEFSKPFETYLDEDAVYNFINSIIEKSKYYSEVLKKHFKEGLVMIKKDNEDLKNSTKCWICDNDYTDNDVTVKDHCYITGK